ncbi:arsenate reductase/protein-tyrosine-phosphatase family protein [Klenkia soli]|uniref:arsenate reductase/protein-tyrosine-phosphatase family protein n=1 Tax=Klenkia soli TaxID=1052260 RepID=UPI0013F4DFB6|nr:hypothetical protein [Klenkia soli]
MRIVFVCTTNVWGSAMAELMTRQLLSEWDPDRKLVQVFSAGVRAHVGAPIPASAQQVLGERGIDGSAHRARWMSPEVLAAADLTLTMGEVQRNAALALNPRGLRSTFSLKEAAGLLQKASVVPPLAPDGNSHAPAVVAAMAAARRFRKVPPGSDDLPDLIDGVIPARALGDQLQAAVRSVVRMLILPEVSIRRFEPSSTVSVSPAVA